MDNKAFDRVLDECLDRLKSGESVEQCLARYPDQAGRLEPLLRIAKASRSAYEFEPSADAVRRARAKLAVASAERRAAAHSARTPGWFERFFSRPLPIAAIASIAVIALTVLLVVVPSLPPGSIVTPTSEPGTTAATVEPSSPAAPTSSTSPTPPTASTAPTSSSTPTSPTSEPTQPTATETPNVVPAMPSRDGNFTFYLSDAPNDIADFASLTITVDSIELRPDSGPAVAITPEGEPVDLVPLQGDIAQELWRGDVPPGDYKAVLLHVSAVHGILASSGDNADVILPSDRLRISMDFSVSADDATSFVFDVTVHRTGNAGGGARYILSPQVSESGVNQPILPVQSQQGAGAGTAPAYGSTGTEPPGQDRKPKDKPRSQG